MDGRPCTVMDTKYFMLSDFKGLIGRTWTVRDSFTALDEREPAGGGDECRIEGGYVGAGRVLHDVKESPRRPPVTCRRASLALGNADRCHLRLVHLVEVDEIAVWIDD